jgi:hypothetical protein
MISVIIYGRNDSHGYNLHKRAALSLNCIAEVLNDPDDEIIFTDYNTPDDFITFPEAIADTLTEKCKRLLRIIRVRPQHHNKYFKATTDLVALEPVSRNVGFRRSNPKNKWMLCTNTDMIFYPHPPLRTLNDVARKLTDGFYELPRFEMPDLLWEGLNRIDPKGNIAKMADWGKRYHINEIIEKPKEILYDAPGDFQLFTREAIFSIQGFDERHNLGWHMDSNLGKRFYQLYGEVKTAAPLLSGWHCNHTRTQTIAHKSGRKNNDIDEVFVQIVRPDLPHQKDSWGLASEKLEEIRLDAAREKNLFKALDRVSPPPAKAPLVSPFISNDLLPCPPEHLKPYVADILYSFPRDIIFGYLGSDRAIFHAFYEVWQALGFKEPIYLVGRESERGHSLFGENEKFPCLTIEEADEVCGLFVSDYRPINIEEVIEDTFQNQRALAVLHQLMILERKRAEDPIHTPRKFIVLNGVQYPVCQLLQRYTNMQENPFGTRIRHGFVVPPKPAADDKKRQGG